MKNTSAGEGVDPAIRLAARLDRLVVALGSPFEEDPRLAHYAMALAETDAARPPAARPPKEDFVARADAFLAAREVALAVVGSRSVRGDWDDLTHRAAALFDVESIRRGHARTLGQLKQMESAFFTEWSEAPPAETRGFWKAIADAGLPFEKRGRR